MRVFSRNKEAPTVEALILRTYAAMTKTSNIDDTELERSGRVAIRLMEQYGYTKGTIVMEGDMSLIWKAFMFTRQCILRDMMDEMTLSKPGEACTLYRDTFTRAERKALEYELTAAKFDTLDKKRIQILMAAGLSTDVYIVESVRWPDERAIRTLCSMRDYQIAMEQIRRLIG